MSFSAKFRRALFATAILLTASQMAMAATTMLVCHSNNNGSLGPDLFELNEARSSVTIKMSPYRSNGGIGLPARTVGPYHATFTPNTITASFNNRHGLDITYIINRMAGTVTVTYVSETTHLVGSHSEWTCEVGKAKF